VTPAEVAEFAERTRRRYVIHVHHDGRRWAFRPWWATMTHGVFHVGEPGAGVWRARTRDDLVRRCERWARRNELKCDIADPRIEVEG
jgi:hypothetical protein